MGGFNGFEGRKKESDKTNTVRYMSIRDFVHQFYNKHHRSPVIAMDMAHHIMQVCTEGTSKNEGISHHTLFKRLTAYLKVGATLVCVFDGPLEECKTRHANRAQASTSRQFGPMPMYAKNVCKNLGLTILEAPAEAEALCAYLQRNKFVDVVFSGDSDILANGALYAMRFAPHTSAAGKIKAVHAEDRYVEVFELEAEAAPRYALMALILGNDWSPGVPKIGYMTASALTHPKTKFAERLQQIASMEDTILRFQERQNWQSDFINELRTNEHKWLERKTKQEIPTSFPDLDLFNKMLCTNVTYDSQLINRCINANKSCSPIILNENFSTLKSLWNQVCPGMRQVVRLDAEKLEKSFRSIFGPMVVSRLLTSHDPTLKNYDFKECHSSRDVELKFATDFSFDLNQEFLIGSIVPKYIYEISKTVKPLLATKKPSASERAAKSNFKITQFFGGKASLSSAAPSFARKNESSEVVVNELLDMDSVRTTASKESSVLLSSPLKRSLEQSSDTDVDDDVYKRKPKSFKINDDYLEIVESTSANSSNTSISTSTEEDVQPIEPVEPDVEPVEPVEPVESLEPVEPVEPVDEEPDVVDVDIGGADKDQDEIIVLSDDSLELNSEGEIVLC